MSVTFVPGEVGDPARGDPAHVRVERGRARQQRLLRCLRVPHAGATARLARPGRGRGGRRALT